MSEFSLYGIDHAPIEGLILRIVKAIGESDKRKWAEFVEELRKHPSLSLCISSVGRVGGRRQDLTKIEDHEITGRRIPAWEDPGLRVVLRELTILSARHRFIGGVGRLHGWLVERPLAHLFATEAERAEFAALDTLVLRPQTPLPRHLGFLGDPSTHHSYLDPDSVGVLARAVEAGGYLRRISEESRREVCTEPVGQFLDRLRHFLLFAAAEGCGLYYQEQRT
jgi:hypothetical protein